MTVVQKRSKMVDTIWVGPHMEENSVQAAERDEDCTVSSTEMIWYNVRKAQSAEVVENFQSY